MNNGKGINIQIVTTENNKKILVQNGKEC